MEEFLDEPGVQEMLSIYKTLGYDKSSGDGQPLWKKLFKPSTG
jgi:hypothetical protein